MGFMTRKNLAKRAAKRVALPVVEQKEVQAVEPVLESKDTSLTREKVQAMPYFKVKSVAQANGIDVADKKTADLRAEVIERLGL